jgi:hypothetical protein
MNRFVKLAALLAMPLALVAAAPAAPSAAIDSTLTRAYGGYLTDKGPSGGDWDQPVFSVATTALIRQWDKHNGEELTGLTSYGWFCECQDWQAKKFRWKRTALRSLSADKVEVKVSVDPGFGEFVAQRLILVREGGRWRIDDLFSKSAPRGIKAEMRVELSEVPVS